VADKKFHHVTLVIEDQVMRALEMEAGLAKMVGNAHGLLNDFVCKLVTEVKRGTDPVRYEYKDSSRGQ